MKQKANINVYLILRKDDQILLSKRQNTGYLDGMWALVSGHGESSESAKQSMIREAEEEVGIQISYRDLEIVHVMHRKTDRENIDIFMSCQRWQGSVDNKEPNKCSELRFFPKSSLPHDTVEYIKIALEKVSKKDFYSELGW